MKKFRQTREVINYAQKYVSGKTLVLGIGSDKYRGIIKPKTTEYIALELLPSDFNLPFNAAAFDTIISTETIEHVEKPWLMVKELSRILKTEGICILTAPFLIPYHADPHDYFRYTKEGLVSLFENEGFEIMEYDDYGQSFFVLSEFIKYLWFNPHKKRKKGSWKIVNFINKIAGFLNKFARNKIIYTTVYVVAKKK